MNVARILLEKYPNTRFSVVNNEIRRWPEGVRKPTQRQLEEWWPEVERKIHNEQIRAERQQRYRAETDPLLFDALEELSERFPELQEWKQAKEAIRQDAPYESIKR